MFLLDFQLENSNYIGMNLGILELLLNAIL